MVVKFSVSICDIDEQMVEYKMVKKDKKNSNEKNEMICWTKVEDEYVGVDYDLKFIMDKKGEKVTEVIKGEKILDDICDLKSKFMEILFEIKMNQFLDEDDGFDDSIEDGEEINKDEIINPYDPKLIRVDTKPFPIFQVQQMIEDKEIDLSPDFQRGFVWNDITRKSRLIESLLLRIPLPVFYLSQDEDGMFQVVDGVQRLTVINSFMKNEFKLKNLEYLKECEGKWYKNSTYIKEDSLPAIYARRIEQSQLFINIIDPQTPNRVKYDIFKRINTGGKALNNQEIRNCLANRKTRSFLRSLSTSDEFISATKGSISHTRMADEELILRFIAFYLIDNKKSTYSDYKGGMDLLLDETVNILNKMEMNLMKKIRIAFLNAMDNAFYLFGDEAFRKARYVNKSLFVGISRVLCYYDSDEIKTVNKETINFILSKRIKNDIKFSNALSMATNDARNVNQVFKTIKDIVGESKNA